MDPAKTILSRIAFFMASDEQLVTTLAKSIAESAKSSKVELTELACAILAWSRLQYDVPNGGFTQFFYNHGGDAGVEALCNLLTTLQQPRLAALLQQATAIYRKHRKKFRVDDPWQGLFGSIQEFDTLDRDFFTAAEAVGKALGAWIRQHINDLAVGNGGRPFDTSFTGILESHHSNGQLAKSLVVKNGKADGPYKEFFEDGTFCQGALYKNGTRLGAIWPNGQLKRGESQTDDRKIIEFYYPSGKLHKRIVKGSDNTHLEPIRLYYENGQLAEELAIIDDGTKYGDWKKFFEDGTPQLQAKRTRYDGDVQVRNALDASRKPVVKDGEGIFDFVERSIDWDNDVYFKFCSEEKRFVIEMHGGVPHGKCEEYNEGVLDNITNFVRGQRHGDSTTYWDNGRVHFVSKYVNGQGLDEPSPKFPKFDRPVPVVILTVEANEDLYTAWRHLPVDQYPAAQNLPEIRAQLQIPQFLRDVHKNNLAGKLKDRYEDASTFNDGIAYFLTVDQMGSVIEAKAHASGTYSGGHWETYVPLLKQLRFTPGTAHGKPVQCRVLARVDHTFTESPA